MRTATGRLRAQKQSRLTKGFAGAGSEPAERCAEVGRHYTVWLLVRKGGHLTLTMRTGAGACTLLQVTCMLRNSHQSC